jgi:uncharacterized protein YggL (DUF469 family)
MRKKRHLGEFREWGLPLAIQRTHPDGFDDFLDAFIAQAIAAHGFAFRGGGHGDRLTGVIGVGRTGDPTEARLQHVRHWLGARADVKQYVVGPLVDLWHRPFDDWDTIEEQLSVGEAEGDAG